MFLEASFLCSAKVSSVCMQRVNLGHACMHVCNSACQNTAISLCGNKNKKDFNQEGSGECSFIYYIHHLFAFFAMSSAKENVDDKTTTKKKIILVVTNVDRYDDPKHPTGLWISELTHAYDVFAANGYEQKIISPKGGKSPLEPRSLKWPLFDASAKGWVNDKEKMSLLESTARPEEVDAKEYDAIYFTGGHAVMWDFPEDEGLQELTREIYEKGGIVSSVCHGFVGLLNVRLSDGNLLVKDKKLTGYSWFEEILAGVSKQVPFNSEQKMKDQGANYQKAFLPFVSNVYIDDRLVTGQNPQSAKETAEKVVSLLK